MSAADLYSPYVGDAEITVTNLFQRARDASPAVLFIDEIGSLQCFNNNTYRIMNKYYVLSALAL